ncbi:MAG TPA: metallophosphoesterase, partial [Candidatus Saccharimonadales bacterium]|nr:metallophosphoesterase [Candidatus Saccharimonadales bacterium]
NEYQNAVFNLWTSILRKNVAWSTIGNHETYTPLANGRFPFLDIFTQPMNGEAGGVASGTERYYSFDYANIHFVCLDSMTSDRSSGGIMANWLRQDLAGNTSDWLIAFFHHPPYTKGSHDSDNFFGGDPELVQMREGILPILESYGVDLVLSGHSHIYERSFLLNGHYSYSSTLTGSMVKDSGSGRPNDTGAYLKPTTGPGANQGAVYVVAGSSGWATFRNGHHPAMFADELEMGSLVVDINTNRLDAVFLRDTGAIDDSFTIIKGGPAAPFRLASISTKNGKVIARWKSVSGFTYRVESAPDLEGSPWQAASGNIVATGATTSWTNSVAPNGNKAFYRVAQVGD